MKFVILMAESDPDAWATAAPEAVEAIYAAHRAFDAAVAARGELVGGQALDSRGTTMRSIDGAWVTTEGPYAESVEQLTGFYVIDVPTRDDALELMRLLPSGYTLEVREVAVLEDY